MRTQTHQQDVIQKGYTLIELLVAIFIVSLILPVLYFSIQSLYSTHARTLARSIVLSKTTNGLQEIVRDVRASVYAENGALPLVSIATSSLTLYTDTDLDRQVEQVRYYLDGTTMMKDVIEPTPSATYPAGSETTTTLTSNITNNTSNTPVFTYYTATGTEITTQADILDVHRIEITFEAEARFKNETGTIVLTSSSAIRNLKDSY